MKFNFPTSKKHQSTNHEVSLAWKMGLAAELYAIVVTASLSDKLYESGNKGLESRNICCLWQNRRCMSVPRIMGVSAKNIILNFKNI